MRILHIRDFANVARNLADAQTALGHPARVLGRREAVLDPPDLVLPPATDPIRAQLAILRRHADLRAADVLHIHGGIWRTEIVWSLLRRAFRGKVFVVQLHGSEARTGKGLHHLGVADRVLCSTPDLLGFAPGAEWLPNPVRMPTSPSGIPPGKPVVGHFPTRRAIKGTDRIVEAFRELGPTMESAPEPGIARFENATGVLLVAEGVPHARALELMDGCALVVDQVNDLGIYSMVSVEAMARGKVVLCSYNPAMYPTAPPILRVDRENLPHVLAESLRAPDTWETVGREGRDFVERVHASDKVAARALRAYYRSAATWTPRGDELKRYWRARGPGYLAELAPGKERGKYASIQERALLDLLRGIEFRTYVEVGCGYGRILRRVVQSFAPNAAGIDLSLEQLRAAREYVPVMGPRLLAGVAERLPLRDGCADLVLASEVLMHLDPSQVRGAVREMARVTRRYAVSVDWYEDFMVGEQVRHSFVHDYAALYAQEGFTVRRVPVGGPTLQSIFVAERTPM